MSLYDQHIRDREQQKSEHEPMPPGLVAGLVLIIAFFGACGMIGIWLRHLSHLAH